MRSAGAVAALLASAACAAPPGSRPRPPSDELAPVPRAALVVESGRVEPAASGAGFLLAVPTVRALVGTAPRPEIELDFEYRGPTAGSAPLASGELRRQIGVKLRARDTCNVVYVMWHVAPAQGIHVSVKSDPGARTHAECRDGGYVQLAPRQHRPPAPIRPGETHRLRAAVDGDRLRVTADGVVAWEGTLPPEAMAFDGPVGLRSDNGAFSVRVRASR